jgi:biopolymer transport protein ExbD
MNKATKPIQSLIKSTSFLLLAIFITAPVIVSAITPSSSPTSTSTTEQNNQATRLANIIAKGNQEIDRRLASLANLASVITAAKHITSGDKTSLTNELNTEVTGLTQLRAKLDAETTVAAAGTDAQSIFSEYRVYALVLPKVWLVRLADQQQDVEAKLVALAKKLQTRIDSEKAKGKDTASLQSMLDDLNAKVGVSQPISTAVEQKVLPLLPSDWNSDHTILSGDYAQLKTAHTDNQAAYQDATKIIAALKTMN